MLVNNSVLYPSAVVADSAEERIYWVDRIRETIETVTYDGTDRRLVRRITNTLFYDIALFRVNLILKFLSHPNLLCAFISMAYGSTT